LYHIKLGITRFFFFDNDGTFGTKEGIYSATITTSKYSVNISCLNMTDEKKKILFD